MKNPIPFSLGGGFVIMIPYTVELVKGIFVDFLPVFAIMRTEIGLSKVDGFRFFPFLP